MDFKMDANGDIAVENGDFVMVEGIDATVQFLNQSLRLFLGEWFLDESEGFPYFDEVFIKNPNPVTLNSIFVKKIMSLPGVLELLSLELDVDPATRRLSVAGTIRGLDGEADFSVSTIIPQGA